MARAQLFEVRLHRASPFPKLVTGALIATVLFGLYLLLALLSGQNVIDFAPDGTRFNSGSWAAFVMSLIFGSALTMPALGHQQWCDALADLKRVLSEEGQRQAEEIALGGRKDRKARVLLAFAFGAIGGFVFNGWMLVTTDLSVSVYLQSTGLWFVLVSPVLFGLGARAGVLLSYEDQELADLVREHLIVDLAQIERLQVFGRLALRGALSWLVMSAIILLFFIYTAPVPVSVGALSLSLLAGVYAFASPIRPVTRHVASVKDEALEAVRSKIAIQGQTVLAGETQSIGLLAELTAYEAWLEKRPIWPISAPITRRLALYGFIPVLAWFGAASAEMVLDRLT